MADYSKEIDLLNSFNKRVQTILNYSFVNHVLEKGTHVKFRIDAKRGITAENNFASQEALDATIINLRFFMQNNERISLENLSKIYPELKIPDKLKEEFKYVRNKLNSELDKSSKLKVNKKELTNREILEAYVYGTASHETRKKEYKQYFCHELGDICLAQFNEIMFYFINCLAAIKNTNVKAINELQSSR